MGEGAAAPFNGLHILGEIRPVGDSSAGIVANMSATCWPDSQMLAHFADMPLSWRHKIDPDTTFLCRGWPTFTPFFF
jgi:hypothetical protein